MAESSGTTGATKSSSKTKAEDTETQTSRDARFSTYRPATDDELDNADEVLPPGPHVMQEPGEPSEGDPGFKFANKG